MHGNDLLMEDMARKSHFLGNGFDAIGLSNHRHGCIRVDKFRDLLDELQGNGRIGELDSDLAKVIFTSKQYCRKALNCLLPGEQENIILLR